MPDRLAQFKRSATRSGWRGVVMLGLIPVMVASLPPAIWAHGVVKWTAYGVYCAAAVAVLVLGWQISFGSSDE